MGLSSALNTSLNGLSLNETAIGVLGNNIANAGTNGFKASRVEFSTQLANTLSFGAAPSETSGGTDPLQTGLGAKLATIRTDFSQGSITSSNSPSDLAIQGDGFFILGAPGSGGGSTQAKPVYTRNGSFRLNSNYELSSNQGMPVLGFPVSNYVIQTQLQPQPISIPLGTLKLVQPTTSVTLSGALPPTGNVATRSTVATSAILYDAGNVVAGAAQPVSATTLLTDVRLSTDPAGPAAFNLNDTIRIGPTKGGRVLDARATQVSATSTVSDFADMLNGALGLHTVLPATAGVTVDVTGQLVVTGNYGTVNDFDIPTGAITTTPAGSSTGSSVNIGFTPNAQRANGQGVATTFTVYDNIGNAQTVFMTAVLESQTPSSTIYRYFFESPAQGIPAGGTFATNAVATGTITFDNQGRVTAGSPTSSIVITPPNAGQISFSADLSQLSGLAATSGSLNLTSQDGSSAGTLSSYVIDESGTINGVFDNGVVRPLGQIALARFSNPAGLLQSGSDTYTQGVASGLPAVSLPGVSGTGSVRAGSIEQSNTDIGKNLVDLIVTSTNYRGNARVISSIDQLMNELLQLGR